MKQKSNKDKQAIRELERTVHLLKGRLEKLENEKGEEERILGIGTETEILGKRKDGSRIFGRTRKLKEAKDEDDFDRACGAGTYRKKTGRRKDGSIIWSRKSCPLEEEKKK